MKKYIPQISEFDSSEEYENAIRAFEDACDDYVEKCIERYYERC